MSDTPNFRSTSLIPPQNIEVEEAILGGILLDPEAIGRVAEKLIPEAFYIPTHTDIYKACLALNGQGKPTDLLTVTDWLIDQKMLEKIGGQAKLIQLLERTVSAVNIDSLAVLVMDKYIRRELIKAGTEVTQLGFAADRPLEVVLDESEQQILNLTQARPKQGLTPIKEIVATTYQDIQDRHDQLIPPGLTSDFSDLDGMTGGFQRSDLIIIAGRPSMGKCLAYDSEIVLADGSISTIEQLYLQQQAEILTLNDNWKFSLTKPSAYVDDGIKPVFKVITRLGRSIETTITHPFLTFDGWKKLSGLQVGEKIAVPRTIPVFGIELMRECEVKLLGYLIGDGCLTQNRVSFTNVNLLIQKDFTNAALQFGNLKVRIATSNETRAASLFVTANLEQSQINREQFGVRLRQFLKSYPKVSDRQLAKEIGVSPSLLCQWKAGVCAPTPEMLERICARFNIDLAELVKQDLNISSENSLLLWLRSIGLAECNAHHKFVPDFIFRLQQPLVALFLNRLFATDGWASVLNSGQAQLGFASVSNKLARQVQHLLLRFGIIAQLKHRSVKYKQERRDAWQLDITDSRSISTFITEIGVFGKEEAVEKVRQALITKKYQTNRDLIPISVWANLNIARGAESWKSVANRAGIVGTSNIHVGKRAPTRERLLKLATAVNDRSLKNLATSQVYWDEIVSIEYTGDKQVYDLTIPETHNFVANDICVHNTAISLNIAYNMAKLHQQPVLVFSLEMSKDQLVQRLIASEAGVDSNRLRAGRISPNEWDSVYKAVDRISELPIYIDDNASMMVMEMRSQARKIQAENGGQLGLIMIDYLQLMEGSSDNRVQEISKITRSLKGLARELQVPLIALSQLSRGVEARNNKRPMMSDLRESGCLTGDTLITMADTGIQISIRDLVDRSNFAVWALDEKNMQLQRAIVSNAFATGVKPVWKLQTQSGRTIRATANHKFLTFRGWKRLDELVVDDRLAVPRRSPPVNLKQSMNNEEIALLGHLIGDGCTLPRHSIQYTTREPDLAQIVANLATEIFGDRIVPRIQQERDWYQVYLTAGFRLTHNVKNPITEWLDSLNIFGLRSYEKFVPERIFSQPQAAICLFLRHLWSTDGCIHISQVMGSKEEFKRKSYPSIYYSSSSYRLASHVQSLLLILEINATLRTVPQINTGRDQYHVSVSGKQDMMRFVNLIGAVGNYKQNSLSQIAEYLDNITAITNRDVIPHDFWRMYAVPAMQAAGITNREFQAQLGNNYCGTSLYKTNLSRERASKIAIITKSLAIENIANSDIYWDKIVSITPDGESDVYDLTVPEFHNFVANNIIAHNSIEQDADLIIMLYRDAYYNPDTPDRDITELIITKHRNGPTGVVKLVFDPGLTKFKNLARPMN